MSYRLTMRKSCVPYLAQKRFIKVTYILLYAVSLYTLIMDGPSISDMGIVARYMRDRFWGLY